MSSLSTFFRTLLLTTLLLPTLLRGWVSMDVGTWPDGTVNFVSKLGTTPTYTSGYNPNRVATTAATAWNPYMLRLRVTTQEKSRGTGTSSNSSNEIYFSKTYEGESIDSDILAFALVEYKDGTIKETDIVVNESHSWSHYTGYVQYEAFDLQRVLAHEVGHALGLDHPDEAGQDVLSLMNAYVSETSQPTDDDIEGIASLYGINPQNPPPLPVIAYSGSDQTVEERQSAYFYATVRTRSLFSYQWFRDGVAIPGETMGSYSLTSTTLADAGNYSCVVSNLAGSVRTPEFALRVTPRKAPIIDISILEHRLYQSQTLYMYANLREGSSPVSYQWMKDGVELPGQTSQTLHIYSVSLLDAGSYTIRATNDVGTHTSEASVLTVARVDAPRLYPGLLTLEVEEGDSFYLPPSYASDVIPTIKWYKDGVLIPNYKYSTFSRRDAKPADAGQYTVEISNPGGSVSATYTLNIVPRVAPRKIWLTGTSTYNAGDPVVLQASVMTNSQIATNDFVYSWYHDGSLVQEGNLANYTLSNATQSAAGEYYCLVKTPMGIFASNGMLVQMTSPRPGKPWVSSYNHAGTAYFGFATNSRVERVSLLTGTPLPPLVSPVPVKLLTASAAGVFVSDNSTVHCIRPDGSSKLVWTAENGAISCIGANATQLFVGLSKTRETLAVELSSGNVLTRHLDYSWTGHCIAVSEPYSTVLTFGYWVNAQIGGFSTYSAEGMTLPLLVSPVSNDGICPTRLMLSRNERYAFDDTGYIHDMSKQRTVRNLARTVTSIADQDDGSIVVLADGQLIRLNANLSEEMSMQCPPEAVEIGGIGGKTFGFSYNSITQHVEAKELDLSPMQAMCSTLDTMDPSGYPLSVDSALVDKSGKVWMLSLRHHLIACWDPTTNAFGAGYRLPNNPTGMTYIAAANALFLSYANGNVTKIDISKAILTEAILGYCGYPIDGITTAGEHLVIHHKGGVLGTLLTWASDGTQVDSDSLIPPSESFAWSAQTSRLYRVDEGSFLKEVMYSKIYDFGSIGSKAYTFYLSKDVARHPIRVSGEGSVLLAGGHLVDESGLNIMGTLGSGHVDATYASPNWYTLSNSLAGCVVTKWETTSRTSLAKAPLPCLGRRILALPNGKLLVIGTYQGSLRFIVLDSSLTVLSTSGAGPASRLANLSVQADVGVGNDLLVPGFVIKGKEAKNLLVRGVGPTLTEFGVAGALADPQLTLYNSNSAAIQGNDNWFSLGSFAQIKTRAKELGAFNLGDTSRDAVLMPSLAPGLYTAEVRGANSTTGRAIVEMYDADDAPGEERAVNMSARCKITGSREAIGGFVIEGKKPMTVLLRAVGPKLLDYSVTGVLADPKLTLFSGQTAVASNNDWSADEGKAEALRQAFTDTGAFALNESSKDAALLLTLEPGAYTVWMESADGTSGVALLELYVVETKD